MANRKRLTGDGKTRIALPGDWVLGASAERRFEGNDDPMCVCIEVAREAGGGAVTLRMYVDAAQAAGFGRSVDEAVDEAMRVNDPTWTEDPEGDAERAELQIAATRLARIAARLGQPNGLTSEQEAAIEPVFLRDFAAALIEVFSHKPVAPSELVEVLRATALALQLTIAQPPAEGFEEDAARAVVKTALDLVARAGG
jgi:hypothetical protein